MKDSNIITLRNNNKSLVSCDNIYDYLSIGDKNQYIKQIDAPRYDSFERMWLSPFGDNKRVFVMAYKTRANLDKYEYGQYAKASGKIELNEGFLRYLNTCEVLQKFDNSLNDKFVFDDISNDGEGFYEKLDEYYNSLDGVPAKPSELSFGNIITINIADRNIHKVLYDNKINFNDIVYKYKKRLNNLDNLTLDLDMFRKDHIERVSLYKVGKQYLIIGFSKKAKKDRRIFSVNGDFIKYLNTIEEFGLLQSPISEPILDNSNKKTQKNTKKHEPNGDGKIILDFNPIDETLNIQSSIDDILDKISLKGIGSLSIEELNILRKIK